MGAYGNPHTSYNGIALIEFCLGNNFVIADTFFYRKEYGSWHNPMDSTDVYRNAIDHILVNQKQGYDGIHKLGITDCGVCLGPACNTDSYTDHRRMEISLSLPKVLQTPKQSHRTSRLPSKMQLDYSSLHGDPSLQEELRFAIDNKINSNTASIITGFDLLTVDEATKALDIAIREACKEVVPRRKKPQDLKAGT